MYAVLVNVKIAAGRHAESVTALKDPLVPMIKQAPGFVRGTWFGDEEAGNSLMVFDSEETARAMSTHVQAGPNDPVSIEKVQVHEVHAEG